MTKQLNITLPKAWKELTPSQLMFVARLLRNPISETELKMRALLTFSNIKLMQKNAVESNGQKVYLFRKRGIGKFELSVDLVTDMLKHLDWLTESITLFKCPDKFGHYKAPNFKLYGVKLKSWLIADSMYKAFVKTKQYKYLDSMMAVLYQLPNESWDETTNLKRRAFRFRFRSRTKKYVVFLWYTSVKIWLQSKYPYLFDTSDSGSAPQAPDQYVLSLLSALNGGTVANNPQVKETDVHEVFYDLNSKIEKSKTS